MENEKQKKEREINEIKKIDRDREIKQKLMFRDTIMIEKEKNKINNLFKLSQSPIYDQEKTHSLIESLSKIFTKFSQKIPEQLLTYKFAVDDEKDVSHDYICSICLEFKSEYPLQCRKCQTLFCVTCSKNILNCSICKNLYEPNEIKKNKLTVKTIDKIKIKCPYTDNPCDDIILFEEAKNHLSEDCKNLKYDFMCNYCNEKFNLKFFELQILEDHRIKCPEIEVKCEFCNNEFLRKVMQLHKDKCEYKIIKCEDCGIKMPLIDKKKHSKKDCLNIIKIKYVEENNLLKNELEEIKNNKNSFEVIIKDKDIKISELSLEIRNILSDKKLQEEKIKDKDKKISELNIENLNFLNEKKFLEDKIKDKDDQIHEAKENKKLISDNFSLRQGEIEKKFKEEINKLIDDKNKLNEDLKEMRINLKINSEKLFNLQNDQENYIKENEINVKIF